MILQTCNPATNDFVNWVTVPGLIKFKVVRSAGSKPSTLVAHVSTNTVESTTPRFWPFLGIRIIETDVDNRSDRSVPKSTDVMYFAGRIDAAYLKEDPGRGRIWEITARCWLSVLADNNMNDGRWVSAQFSSRGKYKNGSPIYTSADKFSPKYMDNYGRTDGVPPWGEFRQNIIWDLCMNIVPSYDTSFNDNKLGIIGFGASISPPNSLPVAVSFTDTNKSILSVIQELAESDPWCANYSEYIDASYFGTLGDIDLSGLNASTPTLPANARKGIGGDLQMQINYASDGAGRTAEYVARGRDFNGFYANYGPKPDTRANTVSFPIAEVDFGKDGLDIYTSASLDSGGSLSSDYSYYSDGMISSGQGDSVWNPSQGKFRVRKTRVLNLKDAQQNLSFLNSASSTQQSSIGRLSADYAISQIVNSFMNSNGGANRGRITLAGRPKNRSTNVVLRPAEIIKLHIPHLNIKWSNTVESNDTPNSNCDFVVEQWSYEWPEERTIVELTRQQPISLSSSVSSILTNIARGNYIDSTGWIPLWLTTPTWAASFPSNFPFYSADATKRILWRNTNGTWRSVAYPRPLPDSDKDWDLLLETSLDRIQQDLNTGANDYFRTNNKRIQLTWQARNPDVDVNRIVGEAAFYIYNKSLSTDSSNGYLTLTKDINVVNSSIFQFDIVSQGGAVHLSPDPSKIMIDIPYEFGRYGDPIMSDDFWRTNILNNAPGSFLFPKDIKNPSKITWNSSCLLVRFNAY